jgi:hypothetical protein
LALGICGCIRIFFQCGKGIATTKPILKGLLDQNFSVFAFFTFALLACLPWSIRSFARRSLKDEAMYQNYCAW